MVHELKYTAPAGKWLEALPIGNGSLGGMIYGGVCEEKAGLNEESFWAGHPRNLNRAEAREHLEQVREDIAQGHDIAAQRTIERYMLSAFNQPYQPLGTLRLSFRHQGKVDNYERKLDIDRGLVNIRYAADGTEYIREYFSSCPDQVMIIRITAKGKGRILCRVSLESVCRYESHADQAEIRMDVTAPARIRIKDVYEFPEDSDVIYDDSIQPIKGQTVIRVLTPDGTVRADGQSLEIDAADECWMILAATTTYKTQELLTENHKNIEKAVDLGYGLLRQKHISDVESIMNRIRLELNLAEETVQNACTAAQQDADRLTEMLFHYGRYLLMSSSRKGTLPANLQGIWNEKLIPPWWSNWTMNINLQMNYWMACRGNMTECMEPLLTFIRRLSEKGKETAKVHYRCRGWVSHHMTDIWMNTSPVGYEGRMEKNSASWAMWPMSGVWFCLCLWEYYEYTGDRHYLIREAYPVMKGCLEFLEDWMVVRDGRYCTVPSISPENLYLEDGKECAVCSSSAMDMELIGEFLEMMLKAMEESEETEEQKARVRKYLAGLSAVKTGVDGSILEWGKEAEETEPGHRHFSHLFSLYPGHYFMKKENADLKKAAELSMRSRMGNGGGGTGWSRIWAICLWARLGYGEEAYKSVKIFQDECIFPNLFGLCPPEYFQIDCNLGFPAAIMEMLLQEEEGLLIPLPALPEQWKSGRICGLLCRGGHVIDLEWQQGCIAKIRLAAGRKETIKIRVPQDTDAIEKCGGILDENIGGVLEVECESGEEYEIRLERRKRG